MKSRTSFGYFLLASKTSLLRLFSKILPVIFTLIFTLIFPVIFPVIYRSFLPLIIIGIIIFKPINSMAWEGSACFSPDMQSLYFASERDGGYGGRDIWVATKNADNYWGNVKNLGPIE